MKHFYFILIFSLFCLSCTNKKTQEGRERFVEYSADDYYNLGLTNYYDGKYKEALANYEKAISIDSMASDYFLNRGVVKGICNDTIGELNDYIKAIQLDTLNGIAYYNIGCIFSDLGDDSVAIKYYLICQRIDPTYYPVYYNCAYSQYQIKDYKEALKNFQKSILVYEDQKFYAYYYMGLIYKEIGETSKAIEYLEKAKALGNKKAEQVLKDIP